MGKDEFLQLLIAQLSHQDPMNPVDGHEFAAQLAQFTSLEQLIAINGNVTHNGQLSGMLAQSINSGVAAGLIGKTVQAEGNALEVSDEGATPLNFEIGGNGGQVSVTIMDEAGQVVRKIEHGELSAGKHTIEWDGLADSGSRVPPGSYTFEVSATDGTEEPVPTLTFVRGKVDRVTFGQNGILLWLGELSVAMQNVSSVE